MDTNETTQSHEPILITMQDQEGGFFIVPQGNGKTATIADPNQLPDWVGEHIGEGNSAIVSANLEEYWNWIDTRIGHENRAKVGVKEDAIQFDHLQWDAADIEGDIVVIAPDINARSTYLGEVLLGLDTSVDAYDGMKADAVIITKSYGDQPTDEVSLEEAQGQGFKQGEQDTKTAQG